MMALDEFMREQLEGMQRTFDELTARLADDDVIGDPTLLRTVSSQRARAEEAVLTYQSYLGRRAARRPRASCSTARATTPRCARWRATR